METEGKSFLDGARYILGVIVIILVVGLVMMMPKGKERYESWEKEVYIVKKEIAEADGETIYLLHGEDKDGWEMTYRIADEALTMNVTAENAYKEIRQGRHYRFRVEEGAKYGSYYPCVLGAERLINGFSTQETSAAQ